MDFDLERGRGGLAIRGLRRRSGRRHEHVLLVLTFEHMAQLTVLQAAQLEYVLLQGGVLILHLTDLLQHVLGFAMILGSGQ